MQEKNDKLIDDIRTLFGEMDKRGTGKLTYEEYMEVADREWPLDRPTGRGAHWRNPENCAIPHKFYIKEVNALHPEDLGDLDRLGTCPDQ